MKIYIVRHGKALPTEINPQHPLSELGKMQIQQLAQFLSKKKLQVSHIYHSGLLRARETAEILSTVVDATYGMEENKDLLPEKSANLLASDMDARSSDVMLVGHLPLLSALVSELVLGNANFTLINFFPGSMVCLERIESRWIIDWILASELFL